jgi:hypothetical protein
MPVAVGRYLSVMAGPPFVVAGLDPAIRRGTVLTRWPDQVRP